MDSKIKKYEVVEKYIAYDGTEFNVIAKDPKNPTDEELNYAITECRKYEESAYTKVLNKLIKSDAIITDNFENSKSNNIKIKTVGSSEGEGEEFFTLSVPTFIRDIFDIKSNEKFMIFKPNTQGDLYLFDQFFEVGHFFADGISYGAVHPSNYKIGETYFIFWDDMCDSIFEKKLMKSIGYTSLKDTFDNVIKKLDSNLDIIKNPDTYTFNVCTAELTKDGEDEKR